MSPSCPLLLRSEVSTQQGVRMSNKTFWVVVLLVTRWVPLSFSWILRLYRHLKVLSFTPLAQVGTLRSPPHFTVAKSLSAFVALNRTPYLSIGLHSFGCSTFVSAPLFIRARVLFAF